MNTISVLIPWHPLLRTCPSKDESLRSDYRERRDIARRWILGGKEKGKGDLLPPLFRFQHLDRIPDPLIHLRGIHPSRGLISRNNGPSGGCYGDDRIREVIEIERLDVIGHLMIVGIDVDRRCTNGMRWYT